MVSFPTSPIYMRSGSTVNTSGTTPLLIICTSKDPTLCRNLPTLGLMYMCNMHALWATAEGKDLSPAIVQLIEFKLGSQLVHVDEQEVRITGYLGDVRCKFNFFHVRFTLCKCNAM